MHLALSLRAGGLTPRSFVTLALLRLGGYRGEQRLGAREAGTRPSKPRRVRCLPGTSAALVPKLKPSNARVHNLDAQRPQPLKRVLVLQLERLGDVIQSTPLLLDLVAAYPDVAIDLFTLDPLSSVVAGLPNVHARGIPVTDVLELNHEVASARPGRLLLPRATAALEGLKGGSPYDLVINLTHSEFAAFWAARAGATERTGAFMNEAWERMYDGAALKYLVACMGPACTDPVRNNSWFNLVDLYRATVRYPGGDAPLPPVHAYIARGTVPPDLVGQNIVALNPSASDMTRAWPAERYGALARALHGEGFTPVLVGSSADVDLCAAVRAAAGVPAIDLAGKTTIPELAAALERASLVVSNDTGTAHVAAAVGTPVLGIYGVKANFRETAPWGAGHLVIQGPGLRPMESIPYPRSSRPRSRCWVVGHGMRSRRPSIERRSRHGRRPFSGAGWTRSVGSDTCQGTGSSTTMPISYRGSCVTCSHGTFAAGWRPRRSRTSGPMPAPRPQTWRGVPTGASRARSSGSGACDESRERPEVDCAKGFGSAQRRRRGARGRALGSKGRRGRRAGASTGGGLPRLGNALHAASHARGDVPVCRGRVRPLGGAPSRRRGT